MSNPIAYHRIRTENGTYEVPIFSVNDPTILDKSLKVMTHNGLGCYDLIDDTPENKFPLKVTVDKYGLPVTKVVNGVVPITKFLSIDNAFLFDSAATMVENTPEYFHISTIWVGAGIVMPISLLPNHQYRFSFDFEITSNSYGEGFVQVGIWNYTKNEYIASWFLVSQMQTGIRHTATGIVNTATISRGDVLEMEFFHSNIITEKDLPFAFKIFKDSGRITLI